MGVFHLNDLPKEKRIQMIGEFYDIIDSLKNRTEVRLFFKDLLMPDEIATLMRRIEVAVFLNAGFTYKQISQILGVGKGKITNVQKTLLKEGSGYKIIIKRLLENRKKRLEKIAKENKIQRSSFEKLKKQYPLHFLLPNLFDKITEKLKGGLVDEKETLLFTPSLTPFRSKNNRNRNKNGTTD